LVDKPFAADRHGGDLATTGSQAIPHQFMTGIFPRAGDEPAGEAEFTDEQRLIRGHSFTGAAADHGDNFDGIAGRKRLGIVANRRDDRFIELDGHAPRIVTQLAQQFPHGCGFWQSLRFTIDG
jgi:hypothetical protein